MTRAMPRSCHVTMAPRVAAATHRRVSRGAASPRAAPPPEVGGPMTVRREEPSEDGTLSALDTVLGVPRDKDDEATATKPDGLCGRGHGRVA